MLVHKLFSPENIELNFASPPDEVLKALVSLVHSRVQLAADPRIFEKEELHLLHGYLDEGLTILHNLSEAVAQPLLLLVRSPVGVRLNGQTCHLLVVLISPLKDSGAHIQALSSLTSLLRSRSFREELLAKDSPQEIIRAVTREDMICVTGSFYLVGRAKQLVEQRYKSRTAAGR